MRSEKLMRKKIRLQKHYPGLGLLVVETEGATIFHTKLLVATLKGSGIENHYIFPLKSTFFQTVSHNSLVGCEITLVEQDQHF